MTPLNLPLAGLHDCSARLAGQPRFPATRGDCLAGPRPCPHVTCRHHLLGELTRMSDTRAERAMVERIEGGITDTCTLDLVADGPLSDTTISTLTGIDRERISQVKAEALHRLKLALRDTPRSHGERTKRERWTADTRRRALELHAEGLSIRAISDRIGASVARITEALSGEPLFRSQNARD